MSIIYLVRHGQASFGTGDYDRLSPTGQRQVQLLGEFLVESGARIDHIYSGGLRRQRETAEILARALGAAAPPVSIDSAFEEYDSDVMLREFAASLSADALQAAGWPAQRHDRKKFQLMLERAAMAWTEARIAADDLLTWQGFHDRVVTALERIMRQEGRSKSLIISTSGGVIGTIVAHVLGVTNHRGIELNWAVHNASLTRLIYTTDKVSLSMFNALPHLERPALRELITYR
jgi:broad specificity phosphatase PhoE